MWEWLENLWKNKKDPKPPKEPDSLVASEVCNKDSKGLLSKIKDKLSK